jgi:D-beta-D-heptose 7-phosphate kinase/D-beta-D-heptose 1-phosphate adenosyltransferase
MPYEVVEAARARGRKIVFTNGCFDLIHVGHIDTLQRAQSLGDFLVVGLNSDVSVCSLKGPDRPLVPQEERATILNAIRFVDCVITFDEDTPENLVREVRPNILVKGKDYIDKFVAGREFVESYGGHMVFLPLIADRSTSGLIDKLASTT